MNPFAFFAIVGYPGEQVTLPELEGGGYYMLKTLMDNVASLITGLVTPLGEVISTNPVCQLALSVGLMGVGIKLFKRLVGAFGRLR